MDTPILIACERSQRVCSAFRKRGFTNAYSCDISPLDVLDGEASHPKYHLVGDAVEIAYDKSYNWRMMIAHPPCTHLSNAGARWLYPTKGNLNLERYKKGLAGKHFFMQLLNAPIEFICIENPLPSKIFELPPPTQKICPSQFGAMVRKRTLLWLKGLPLLEGKTMPRKKDYVETTNGVRRATDSFWNQLQGFERSRTFKGVAQSMAKQWGDFIVTQCS